jgi:hypothetical protein
MTLHDSAFNPAAAMEKCCLVPNGIFVRSFDLFAHDSRPRPWIGTVLLAGTEVVKHLFSATHLAVVRLQNLYPRNRLSRVSASFISAATPNAMAQRHPGTVLLATQNV